MSPVHTRQPVDRSIPTCALNNEKQRLGMNNPPAAAGGIVGIFLVFGRPGVNNPPAAAGGIYKASACVKTNGRWLISGVPTDENASLDLWINQWLTLPVLYRSPARVYAFGNRFSFVIIFTKEIGYLLRPPPPASINYRSPTSRYPDVERIQQGGFLNRQSYEKRNPEFIFLHSLAFELHVA